MLAPTVAARLSIVVPPAVAPCTPSAALSSGDVASVVSGEWHLLGQYLGVYQMKKAPDIISTDDDMCQHGDPAPRPLSVC